MEFQPSELTFGVLEINQTVDYEFAITFNSPGTWKLAVVALWDGNVSYGGDDALRTFQVSRPPFEYSPIGIVLVIAGVSMVPKAIDLVIRRVRRIGS